MDESFERRLPIYLLLDCSESMVGDGIVAVQEGLALLMQALHSDPHALETAWLSIITFADTATQVFPLSDVTQVTIPHLRVRPGTSLGSALTTLHAAIRQEVRQHSATSKGDWRPICFLLTDGMPTDAWEQAAAATRSFYSSGPLNMIAIGCGDDVDPYVLGQITDNVLLMQDMTRASFRKLFQWISTSLTIASQKISLQKEDRLSLAELPSGTLDIAQIPAGRKSFQQKQLFLALLCSRLDQPYLVRYRLSGRGYEPVRTHKVSLDYFAGQSPGSTLSLSSNQLLGVLPCPYCENETAGVCGCGAIFCCGTQAESIVCPGCKSNLSLGESSTFDLSGRMG